MFWSLKKRVLSEQLQPVQQTKHSSSAVEVTACFSQVREIWLQLAWPDSAGAFIFVTRLTDVSATFSVATHAYSYPAVMLRWLFDDKHEPRVKVEFWQSEQSWNFHWLIDLPPSEFLQWSRLLLWDDDTQDWAEPAGPRPQGLHSAGNACSKTEVEEGVW